jgi:3-phytase
MRKFKSLCLAVSAVLGSSEQGVQLRADEPGDQNAAVVRPEAKVETVVVPSPMDAADDPAIWIHPTDPEKSLVIGTDKKDALHVYNMDGSEQQAISPGARPNNVDVIYGVNLAGRLVDLAIASCLGDKTKAGITDKAQLQLGDKGGVKVWEIDAATRTLSDVTERGLIEVLGGVKWPNGCCTYRSPKSGKCYFFICSLPGVVEQYEIVSTDRGTVTAGPLLRTFKGGEAEGMVADQELGFLYVSRETSGIWKYGAEPEDGAQGKRIAKVGENDLVKDVEGLTIYYASGGKGYLIASSQENNTFKVYSREGDNAFILTIEPQPGVLNVPRHTDGIDVTNRPTSAQFSQGVFVVQGANRKDGKALNQNFKMFAWEDIAGDRLIIDTNWSPRK